MSRIEIPWKARAILHAYRVRQPQSGERRLFLALQFRLQAVDRIDHDAVGLLPPRQVHPDDGPTVPVNPGNAVQARQAATTGASSAAAVPT